MAQDFMVWGGGGLGDLSSHPKNVESPPLPPMVALHIVPARVPITRIAILHKKLTKSKCLSQFCRSCHQIYTYAFSNQFLFIYAII